MADDMGSSDFRQKAQVSTLRRNGTSVPTDPIDEAIATRRKVTAVKMLEQTASDESAAAIESENKRLMAEIENRKLRELSRGEAGAGNEAWTTYVLEELRGANARLAETQERMTALQVNALGERITFLTQELQRSQQPAAESPSQMALVRETIQEARELMQALEPEKPARAAGASDPALQAWLKRTDMEHERWKVDRADKHAERMEALAGERDLKLRQLQIQEQESKIRMRFMSETAPKILEVGQQFLARFVTLPGGGPVTAADVLPAAVPVARPDVAPALPAGADTMTCANCASTIVYRADWPGVICQRCGAEYSNDSLDESTPAAVPSLDAQYPSAASVAAGSPLSDEDAGLL